jgi:hypothetical protein
MERGKAMLVRCGIGDVGLFWKEREWDEESVSEDHHIRIWT